MFRLWLENRRLKQEVQTLRQDLAHAKKLIAKWRGRASGRGHMAEPQQPEYEDEDYDE